MIYVDAFGGVSPCVFTPLEFGNVNARPLAELYREMKGRFTPERGCFINRNYKLFQDFAASGELFIYRGGQRS